MEQKLLESISYLPKLCNLLAEVENRESVVIKQAAEAAYASICRGGLLHVFATGHSHMLADELFFRAGGLAPINPIYASELMVQEGARTSTQNERASGLAARILETAPLLPGDTILLASNSGINAVPIEAAIYAKEKGLTVVGITSKTASQTLEARHESGKKLYDFCDIVIDNHVPLGDGLLTLPGEDTVTGGASTFSMLFLAQRIILEIENCYLADNKKPPVFRSANVPGGTEYNEELILEYQDRIKYL